MLDDGDGDGVGDGDCDGDDDGDGDMTLICESLVGMQKRSDSQVSARGRHGSR